MDTQFHHLGDLFRQLGLPADPAAIEQFIRNQGPLPAGTPLAEATLWTRSQAAFLREQLADDADWAEVVDALNALLSQ